MKKEHLYIFSSTILFSSMEIALKLASNQFNPIQLTFLRFLIGSLILFPLAMKSLKLRKLSFNLNDLKFFMVEGFICVVVSMTLYQLAILNSKASIVAILFSCNPVFVIIFAYLIIKEKIYKKTIITLVMSMSGIICIMNPFHMTNNMYGMIYTLLSAITFALYVVIGKKESQRYGGIVLSCFSFLIGSLEMLILILLTKLRFISLWLSNSGLKIFANVPIFDGITFTNIVSLIYISIFVTGIGYTFYFLAMEKTSAATASLVFYIKPALAPVLALLIIKEPIAVNTLLGIVLIIISSCITFMPRKIPVEPKIDSKTVTVFKI